MIRKAIEAIDGDGFDLALAKILRVMSGLIFFGCFPYFLYVVFFS
ncbi:hypothetical protein OZL92_05030 [Bacillus sonorensis]|uniref:Uncharacterized protein n=2 Tax=Bacillus sonorensis TaxID=119858 RepID=M5PA68_9BACI|nr:MULTISPECIES: hypothetical protein [Bacillus]TWK82436.1 hypothetical protein CHCC20335_3479 [Bacillus paralicheniformis]ASB88822.1 hypothetical protein S101395_02314 [Bacillus sonorensis]EME76368.1 hypothetical protein BSONL12_01257 [Bacillus sonorensis L12]MBG9915380.1 membrane protein [Bacillus sonorensis]MCF7618177.1 hypothetical protein [Bacillus sonorensis]